MDDRKGLQMRNVLVRVFDSGGRPVSNARIGIGTFGIDSGVLPNKYTNSNGEAEFDLDEWGDINIYVNGDEKVSRGPIQGSYRIQIS